MASYKIDLKKNEILEVGFGDPAQNDQIVRDAVKRLDEMIKDGTMAGGSVIKINGPASLRLPSRSLTRWRTATKP